MKDDVYKLISRSNKYLVLYNLLLNFQKASKKKRAEKDELFDRIDEDVSGLVLNLSEVFKRVLNERKLLNRNVLHKVSYGVRNRECLLCGKTEYYAKGLCQSCYFKNIKNKKKGKDFISFS